MTLYIFMAVTAVAGVLYFMRRSARMKLDDE